MSGQHINKAVLVLNSSYEPVSITRAKNALKLLVKGAAVSEEDYGVEIYPGNKHHPAIPLPCVIRLRNYKKIPIRISLLTRPNIYARDHYLCLYCGAKEGSSKIINGKPVRTILTLDHILPESRGGPFAWDNLASCCKTCNLKKGDRTPEEAGMPLLHSPGRLTIHTSRALLRLVGLEEDARWKRYLFC
jgi:5-methylcytosine-specific restriction endonuclease McrA